MKDASAATGSISQEILNISPDGAADFVRQQLSDRSLSQTVNTLNKELMFGSPQQRQDAGKALQRLGFSND